VSRSTIRSARPLARHAAVLVAAAAGAATLLSGCSAGQIAETARKVPSVPGVNAEVGDIAIRNAVIAFPEDEVWKPGSEVPLEMRIVNTGEQPDALVGATSDVASRVELRAGDDAPTASASPSAAPDRCAGADTMASAAPSASASPSESASVSPSVSATPSASTAPTEPPTLAPLNIEVKPGCLVILDEHTRKLVLVGITPTEGIRAGDLVTVKLTFERAGSVELVLPVEPPATPLPRKSEEHPEEAEGGA